MHSLGTYRFDVTDKCVDFMKGSIKDMPGNPGQEVLVEQLDYSGCRFEVTVTVSPQEIDISSNYDIHVTSNHPEAIEIIIDRAKQAGEWIGILSGFPGPWELDDAVRTTNWKIVGYDLPFLGTTTFLQGRG